MGFWPLHPLPWCECLLKDARVHVSTYSAKHGVVRTSSRRAQRPHGGPRSRTTSHDPHRLLHHWGVDNVRRRILEPTGLMVSVMHVLPPLPYGDLGEFVALGVSSLEER